MKKEVRLPKVLVFDINPWREDGVSHTMKNIFSCWDADRVAQIYTKPILPYTKVASRFFQISENDVLKSIFRPWLCAGGEVRSLDYSDDGEINENARRAKVRSLNLNILFVLRELVWLFGHWRGKRLRQFLSDFDPDIIFACIQPAVFSGWIERYVIKKTGKPFVCYMGDDNYSYDSCSDLWMYLHRFWLRKNVKWLSQNCSQMFVIVEKEKEDTDYRFGTNSVILTKGIDFTNKPYNPHPINTPIKFVYTGSLVIGRDGTLAAIADALNHINKDEQKAELFIYSPDVPGGSVMQRINTGCSHFMGFIAREKVEEILIDADVVVFAEALEGKMANAAKLSFSTKITDYLANGKCIFAVGRDYIAPVDYFVRNDSAIVATTVEQIENKLRYIVNNPSVISEYGKKAYDCAVSNHEKGMINKRFIETMQKVIE